MLTLLPDRLSLDRLVLVGILVEGWIPFIFFAWGDELLPKSDNFCKDFESELVLNTDLNNPLTSLDAFLFVPVSRLDF